MMAEGKLQRHIEKATKSKNPLEIIENFDKYSWANSWENEEYYLYCKTKTDMSQKILKWAFKLAEENVGAFYKASSIGWQPKIKQSEMNKNWAKYYVAKDKAGNPVAFAMFRFDWNSEIAVLYCYEMQIVKDHRRRGLGKFMMKALENCGRAWKMEKIILTVLKNNPNSAAFFRSIGFKTDETSPTDECAYEILSKSLF